MKLATGGVPNVQITKFIPRLHITKFIDWMQYVTVTFYLLCYKQELHILKGRKKNTAVQ